MNDLIETHRLKTSEILADSVKGRSRSRRSCSCWVLRPRCGVYEEDLYHGILRQLPRDASAVRGLFYGGKHAQIRCVDCHLPNDNFVNHYVWKGLDESGRGFFYTGLVPEPIHSSKHARKTIQRNCVRCHEALCR
jgi:hypothetical protein